MIDHERDNETVKELREAFHYVVQKPLSKEERKELKLQQSTLLNLLLEKRIEQLKKSFGYSNEQLSLKSTVPKSVISNIYNSESSVASLLTIGRIANSFDMSLQEFFNHPSFDVYIINDAPKEIALRSETNA